MALLGHLAPLCGLLAIELVVARSCDTETFRRLQRGWPSVLWMPAPDDASEATLRAAGMAATDGDIVALLSDRDPLDESRIRALADGPRPVAPPVVTDG